MRGGYISLEQDPPRPAQSVPQTTYQATTDSHMPPEKRSTQDPFQDLLSDPWSRREQKRRRSSHQALKFFAGLFLFFCAATVVRRAIMTRPVVHIDSSSAPSRDVAHLIKVLPSSESIRDYFRIIATETHLAGSDADKAQAEWVRDKWVEFGVSDTKIETYYPLLNYPISRRLAIVSGPPELLFEASLKEDIVEEDESTKRTDRIPAFHGYSGDGNVTGRVVYVNYGRPSDFERLASKGIDVTGTIALMRLGVISRGLKVRAAEQYGCIGALLYPDPLGDGPVGKTTDSGEPAQSYPDGPWRSGSSVERGTVHYLSLLAGDPLTPGYAATEDATRLDREDLDTIPHIPSLPISWNEARPFLLATENLGMSPTDDWVGGLSDVGYFSGPSEAEVNLVNINDYQIKPVWNVIGRIQGSEEPNRAVIFGNHRDAWGFGAVDPSSGTATMMELVRVFGVLLDRGWRPRRTIIVASWDAEEYGTVGSTEWVEDHMDWLDEEAVAYLNVDMAASGPHFKAQASPLLHRLLYEVTAEIIDPRTSLSVLEAWALHQQGEITANVDESNLVHPLGAGSDFVGFFDHVGISSLTMSFGGDYGVYHSDYDSVHWMEKFGDPTFEYHQTMAKIWGLLILRLSDDDILPLYPLDYAKQLARYVEDLSKPGNDDDASVTPLPELSKAVRALHRRGRKFEKSVHKLQKKFKSIHALRRSHKLRKQVDIANEQLARFERVFIDPAGLPGRPWYRHVVYAPGIWSGYGSQVFPSLTEAIESGNLTDIETVEKQLVSILDNARDTLRDKHKSIAKSMMFDDDFESEEDDEE